MTEFEWIQELICSDMEQEVECANSLRCQSPVLAAFREGVSEGLRRAMMYLDLIALENKKAAMPASTAAAPLEKGDN